MKNTAKIEKPVQIQANFSANPLVNWFIASVLQLPVLNRKLRKYHKILQKISPEQNELKIFIDSILEDLQISWQLRDPEQRLKSIINRERPVLLLSNHPLGGRDGLAMLSCCNELLGSKHFKALVNEFLLKLPYLNELFLPITPFKKGIQQLHGLHQTLDEGVCKALLFFSAGLCSRKYKDELSLSDELAEYGYDNDGQAEISHWKALGTLRDPPWQRSFLRLARKYQLDILPLHISGGNSPHFYHFARLREKLGLRFNWEMLLLPREFLYNRRPAAGELYITVGDFLSAEHIARWPRQHDTLWAQYCKHYVYQLPHWQNEQAGQEIENLHHAILEAGQK